MTNSAESKIEYSRILGQISSAELPGLSMEVQSELSELQTINLPNMYETALAGALIQINGLDPLRPQQVRPPLPGQYTSRGGERIQRSELLPLVDQWVAISNGKPSIVIQGGNRYISNYLKETGVVANSMKIMSINKAPFYNQLLTIMSPLERNTPCQPEVLDAIDALLPETMRTQTLPPSRAEVLKCIANQTIHCPFEPITKDENLNTEFAEAIRLIDSGTLPIPNLEAIQRVLEATELHKTFAGAVELHFLDDLFYRGRTLYSLAAVVNAFGGDARAIKLSTIGCDVKSKDLTSPYHRVLDNSKLYPFENSIRTEQGYWQDIGDRHAFTDIGDYWSLLHSKSDIQKSPATYIAWQSKIHTWYEKYIDDRTRDIDMTLIGPLVWLQVYHEVFEIDFNIDKIIDQKGNKLGACVPFAQLIDRFVSQEESVGERLAFKSEVKSILASIQSAVANDGIGFRELKSFYAANQYSIDYHGMGFMFEADTFPELVETKSPEHTEVITNIRNRIIAGALDSTRPFLVGINGVDGAGKTELASSIESSLREAGIEVTTVHLDTFTNSKATRHCGKDPVDDYYNHTFDFDVLKREILLPIVAGQLPKVALKHVDPRINSTIIEHSYDIAAAPSVALIEGVFLFRPELQDYFNLKIFVDIPVSTMRSRAITRDVPRFGFEALAKLINKYIPAQEQYLQTIQPREIADIIVDNTDWSKPVLTKGG